MLDFKIKKGTCECNIFESNPFFDKETNEIFKRKER